MSATVVCSGQAVRLRQDESVLAGLLRAGVELAYGCRAGACQSCLVRAKRGAPPAAAQVGLKDALKAQGFFLACTAVPSEDLEISLDGAALLNVPARIAAIEPLGQDVARVRVEPEGPFAYRAGQFVNVVRPDGLTRSYSIASLPEDGGPLELHVRALPHGRMSNWLNDPSNVGASIELRGPAGECFYTPADLDQPLLLAGAGTGLAPLLGIVRTALLAGHRGPIALFHGARVPAGLYLVDELRALAGRHPNLSYVPCVLEGEESEALAVGRLDKLMLERHPSLRGHRVYLCGDAELVLGLRRKAFLAGAALTEIHADAFVTAPAPAAA